MWKFITGNVKEFWRGTVAGGCASSSYIWINKIIILDYIGSLFTIAFSAAIGGMLTALGADYYKHKLKHKLFKPKKDADKEKEHAA